MSAALALAALVALPAAAARPAVIVNDTADPVSLDPHREFDASSDNIVNQLFDGLVRLAPDGTIRPALAVAWRRVDSLTLEFDLRPGVRFHNGEPFDSEAVRFSLARQLDASRPAPNAGMLGSLYAAEPVGPLKVRLKTREPDGVLLNRLPMFFKILPPRTIAQVGDAGFAAKPVGTGPYEFVRWEKGRSVELRGVADHWSGARSLPGLTFRFVPRESQLKLLLDGEADMVSDLSGLDTAKVAARDELRIVKTKGFYTLSLLFNTLRPPFSDPAARRAAVLAVDARDLIRYGARGNAEALRTLTVPGQFGHDPSAPPTPHDLDAARALLKGAFGPERPRVKALARAEVADFAKVLARQLERAGFAVELETGSQETVFTRVVRPNLDPAAPAFDGDLVITHYVDPTAHAHFPYSILVHSKGPYSLVRDAEFDALFERMVRSTEAAEQEALCRGLEEIARRKTLAVSLVQVVRPFALRRGLAYAPHLTGMLDFRDAYWEEGHDRRR